MGGDLDYFSVQGIWEVKSETKINKDEGDRCESKVRLPDLEVARFALFTEGATGSEHVHNNFNSIALYLQISLSNHKF